jgi:chromosome segregation ATPase
MSSKKSGDLEDVPSLMLSKDDVTSRPPVSGGKKQKPKKAEGDNRSSGGSPLTALVLVLLLAAVGFLYYQLYEERKNMRASEEKLAKTLASLNQLGSQLNVQDQALSETGGNVEKRLAVLDSEIRKLWALSNKKNKDNISSNTKALAEQKKGLAWLSKKVKATEKQAILHSEVLDNISNRLEETEKQLVSVGGLEKKTAQLGKQVARLSKSDSKAAVEALGGRVEELELSIAAIDAHRAQVNRNLDKVRQELTRLSGGGQ